MNKSPQSCEILHAPTRRVLNIDSTDLHRTLLALVVLKKEKTENPSRASVPSTHRQVDGLDSLGHATDLVHLKQKAVARLRVNGFLHALRVGDSEVITHNLGLLPDLAGKLSNLVYYFE